MPASLNSLSRHSWRMDSRDEFRGANFLPRWPTFSWRGMPLGVVLDGSFPPQALLHLVRESLVSLTSALCRVVHLSEGPPSGASKGFVSLLSSFVPFVSAEVFSFFRPPAVCLREWARQDSSCGSIFHVSDYSKYCSATRTRLLPRRLKLCWRLLEIGHSADVS